MPSVDPWFYTALWTNYIQIQSEYHSTDYASRLPWIVPGYLLNKVVDPSTAYFTIHVLGFLGGPFCSTSCADVTSDALQRPAATSA